MNEEYIFIANSTNNTCIIVKMSCHSRNIKPSMRLIEPNNCESEVCCCWAEVWDGSAQLHVCRALLEMIHGPVACRIHMSVEKLVESHIGLFDCVLGYPYPHGGGKNIGGNC